MVTATDDKTIDLEFPEARTPGQEAGQEILAAVMIYNGSDKGPENRVILATDTTHALWELVRAHKDDEPLPADAVEWLTGIVAGPADSGSRVEQLELWSSDPDDGSTAA